MDLDGTDVSMTDEHDDCTATLVTLPLQTATRVAEFLRANDISCRLQQTHGMTPERMMEEIRASNPEAARALGVPVVGGLLRTRLKHGLRVEMQKTGMDVSLYDVLVRPSDLPAVSDVGKPEVVVATTSISAGGVPPSAPPVDPWARPGESVAQTATPDDAAVVCERQWDAAWLVVDRLTKAGVPASVLPVDGSEGAGASIDGALFRVVVQPGDLERARAETGDLPQGG